jgi:hypothetical protein
MGDDCTCSRPVAVLAYASLAYLCASLLYVLIVRCFGLGTPFKDTLTDAQRDVLSKSKRDRGTAFAIGAATSIILLIAVRPLRT